MDAQQETPFTVPAEMLDLVNDIYKAAFDPGRWTPLVAKACQLFNTEVGLLFTPAKGLKDRYLLAAHNLPEETLLDYSNYYWQNDVWRTLALQRGDTYQGLIQRGENLINRQAFRSTEFFNDHLRKADIETLLVNVLFDESASQVAPRTHFSLMRKPGRESFTDQEVAQMRLLMPHFQNALAFHWQMTSLQLEKDVHEHSLDGLGYGLVLLGAHAKVVYMNKTARRILHASEGLSVSAERLHTHPRSQPVLNNHIYTALKKGVGSSILVQRTANKKPYRLQLAPIEEGHLFARMPGRPAVSVLIHDPDTTTRRDTLETVRALHSLTNTETNVLELLTKGNSPTHIAQMLGCSVHTVRSHLSALFSKTHTTSQRELLAMVGTMAGEMV